MSLLLFNNTTHFRYNLKAHYFLPQTLTTYEPPIRKNTLQVTSEDNQRWQMANFSSTHDVHQGRVAETFTSKRHLILQLLQKKTVSNALDADVMQTMFGRRSRPGYFCSFMHIIYVDLFPRNELLATRRLSCYKSRDAALLKKLLSRFGPKLFFSANRFKYLWY